MSYFVRTYSLSLLLLASYALPWIVNPGAGLSMGAFDLAEWTSIHPVNRAASPTLLTTLLLRLPLVLVTFVVVISTQRCHRFSVPWWIALVTFGILIVVVSPPLEFLTENRHDPNYRQQAILVVIMLLGGVFGFVFSAMRHRFSAAVLCLALAVAVASGWIGVLQSYDLMIDLRLPSQLGPGIYVFSLISIFMIVDTTLQRKRVSNIHAHPLAIEIV